MWKQNLGDLYLGGSATKKTADLPKLGPWFERLLVYGGIVLPTLALTAECQLHICARHFFDPFPSNSHVLLFSLVPIASLLAWLSIRQNMVSQLGLALFLNGMAMGISLLYAIMFLPLTMQSMQYCLLFGFGLLGLSPAIALGVLWGSGDQVSKVANVFGTNFQPGQVKNAGHLVILLMVLCVELPSTVTRVALGMASKPETQVNGLNILRTVGSHEVMLRACYERSGRATDIVGSLYENSNPVNVETMRSIFYKATGRTYNSFPIPESARATMNHMGTLAYDGMEADDEFDMDPDVAGEMVSGVSRGLSVSESKLAAKIDSDACVSQLDWNLDFSNKSKYDREVRTRIRLPHGAAVNQASLIVDGKEFEVQITPRELARQMYQEAVKEKKNPLLVSVSGEDTVLVQCYPVPPGNKVKLHLGIVAPLSLDRNKQAVMTLPQFEERNFQINVPHTISLSANHEMTAPWGQLKQEHNGNDFLLSGQLDSSLLATGSGIINVKRSDKTEFWSKDDRGNLYFEKLSDVNLAKPSSLSIVIDGSNCMADDLKKVCDALRKLPTDIPVRLLFVGDKSTEELLSHGFPGTNEFNVAIDNLSNKTCVGGQKDGLALMEALGGIESLQSFAKPDLKGKNTGAVLWLHGAQPLAADVSNGFLHGIINLPNLQGPVIWDMQLSSGPNVYLDGMDSDRVQKVARFGSCSDDISLLFDQWQHPGLLKTFSRDAVLASRHHAIAPVVTDIEFVDVPPVVGSRATEEDNASAHTDAIAPTQVDAIAPSNTAAIAPANTAAIAPANTAAIAPANTAAACAIAVDDPVPFNGPVPVNVENDVTKHGTETMKQLGQLWAIDKINAYMRLNDEADAHSIAAQNHVVTSISSGVLVDTVPKLDEWSRPQPAMMEDESPFVKIVKTFFPSAFNSANEGSSGGFAYSVPALEASTQAVPPPMSPTAVEDEAPIVYSARLPATKESVAAPTDSIPSNAPKQAVTLQTSLDSDDRVVIHEARSSHKSAVFARLSKTPSASGRDAGSTYSDASSTYSDASPTTGRSYLGGVSAGGGGSTDSRQTSGFRLKRPPMAGKVKPMVVPTYSGETVKGLAKDKQYRVPMPIVAKVKKHTNGLGNSYLQAKPEVAAACPWPVSPEHEAKHRLLRLRQQANLMPQLSGSTNGTIYRVPDAPSSVSISLDRPVQANLQSKPPEMSLLNSVQFENEDAQMFKEFIQKFWLAIVGLFFVIYAIVEKAMSQITSKRT